MESSQRLTQYAKGSGCGCKIQPAVLHNLLEDLRVDSRSYANILVGNGQNDDASVLDLGNGTCLLQTVDFFTPMVDDPYIFGKAAAANALSDIYAMGGKPVMANALLGWPLDQLDVSVAQRVLQGGMDLCASLQVPLVGGHSIDSRDPIYGLSVTGLVDIGKLRTNAMAKAGDKIAITKPLGVGMLAAAHKRGVADTAQVSALHSYLTQVNTIGADLAEIDGVHAITDVTGFGLIGHLLEILQASEIDGRLLGDKIPKIAEAESLAAQFILPDNAMRNWNAYESMVANEQVDSFAWLVDPQTNGGLLFTFSEESEEEVARTMAERGQFYWVIGIAEARDFGSPVRVRIS